MTEISREVGRSFEAFNARFLSPTEIAKSFVPPLQYFRLVENNHSVLVGPRGSGKTTLLKMLQLKSLQAWVHPLAEKVRQSLSFHSIFLGTDVLWGSQLEAISGAIADEYKRSQIRRTSFRLHLCLAFLRAIDEARDESIRLSLDLQRFFLAIDRGMESDLSKAFALLWKLDLTSTSFLGVRVALRAQLSELYVIIENLKLDTSVVIGDFCKLDPISPIMGAIELLNAYTSQEGRRWAILCDELEIAPEMIRRELFQLLRSSSHQVLFKFSLFPHTSELAGLATGTSPAVGDDFESLELSYPYKEQAYPFCDDLLRGMVYQATGRSDVKSIDVLGDGWFDGGRSSKRSLNAPLQPPHGKNYVRARKLERQDRTFSRWLKERGFKLTEVDGLDEDAQAQFRKAMPFILTRSEFISSTGTFSSRKASSLYAGTYSLFAISEGNPRIFINLMKPIVDEFSKKGGTVSDSTQARSLDATVHRYKASLTAIPTTGHDDIQSIMQLVDVIGKFLQFEQLLEPFSAEPASTLLVDKDVPKGLVSLIGRAINSGVLLKMPLERGASTSDSAFSGDLLNARLRICYTLASTYKLPLVTGRTVGFSTILRARTIARTKKPELVQQYKFPFDGE